MDLDTVGNTAWADVLGGWVWVSWSHGSVARTHFKGDWKYYEVVTEKKKKKTSLICTFLAAILTVFSGIN